MIFSSKRSTEERVEKVEKKVEEKLDDLKDQDEGDAQTERQGTAQSGQKVCTHHLDKVGSSSENRVFQNSLIYLPIHMFFSL